MWFGMWLGRCLVGFCGELGGDETVLWVDDGDLGRVGRGCLS
jgi:hypothetical protein